ncbi:hypothetical protein PG984_007350 [Apiospora sp. TS-2023a]
MEDGPGKSKSFDVVIVGAGISGINCAYRLQSQLPHLRYVILEGREDIGGTWDLFRFPGVRSDADLYTYGFEWNRWPFDHPIAEGPLITAYLQDTVSKFSIRERIRFKHQVRSANWSSTTRRWTFRVDHDGDSQSFETRWFVMATGYFNYESPREAPIPGLSDFQGDVIHPQFWPPSYDYDAKRVAIIGSGSTATTLLPHLAKRAAEVTMVQRSPSYVLSFENADRGPSWLRKWLPLSVALMYERLWFLVVPYCFILLCKLWPAKARDQLRQHAVERLPKSVDADVHFRPRYDPCDQRMCISPGGDFFQALHRNARVVTGRIEGIQGRQIQLEGGQTVDADVIVTATGLRMRFGAGIHVQVDGDGVSWTDSFMWNRAMVENVPNMVFMIGYITSAWTLGVDNTAIYLVRILKDMQRRGDAVAVPRRPKGSKMATSGVFKLSSTYVAEGNKQMPVYGTKGPWKPRIHPPLDWLHARWGDCSTDMYFSR